MPEDDQTRRLAKVVGHPLRGKILELLGERGPLGWKELSSELGVKTGALYHHLDILEGLVERDATKKYGLTKAGRIVSARLSESRGLDGVERAAADLKKEKGQRRLAASVLLPRSVISSLSSTRRRGMGTLAFLVLGLSVYVYGTRVGPRLYFLEPVGSQWAALAFLGASLVALFAVAYVMSRVVFDSKSDGLHLSAAVALSYLPVFAFSAVSSAPSISAILSSSREGFTLVLVCFQAWSAAILGAGIGVASGLRIEKALVASLVAIYGTMILMLVQ